MGWGGGGTKFDVTSSPIYFFFFFFFFFFFVCDANAPCVERAHVETFTTLEALYPQAPEDGLDLMRHLLTFNPDRRLTADEALSHPYVADMHTESDDKFCESR